MQMPGAFRRGIAWRSSRGSCSLAVITQLIALMSVVMFGGFEVNCSACISAPGRRMRMVFQFVAAAGLLLAVSPRVRHRAARLVKSPVVFFFCRPPSRDVAVARTDAD